VATRRASTVAPRRLASSALISTTAAAPSLSDDALPAVIVPSLAKAGRRPPSFSMLPRPGSSSLSTTVSPPLLAIFTAAISPANRPSFWAVSARL
jgi:hypothetical protein